MDNEFHCHNFKIFFIKHKTAFARTVAVELDQLPIKVLYTLWSGGCTSFYKSASAWEWTHSKQAVKSKGKHNSQAPTSDNLQALHRPAMYMRMNEI